MGWRICHLLPKSPDNSIDSPQAGERCGENSYDDKEEQFEDIVKYPLPVCSCNHFIGNELLSKEVARPYSHQHISGHPSHILKTFGRQEIPSETYDKQGNEKQQTKDASPNLATFPLLKTRRTKYRLILSCTFGTQSFSAIRALGYRRFLGMVKTIHSVIN
jgi:hypothetical protein